MTDILRLTDRECYDLLLRLFPVGFADPEVLAELAPDGWEKSPLFPALHPAAPDEAPAWNDPAIHRDSAAPPDALADIAELVGRAAWDIFSDNHTVLSPDRREAVLGSFRSSSSFLDAFHAHATDARPPEFEGNDRAFHGGSMTYYMGLSLISRRTDFTPLYVALFTRLRRLDCDWLYTFPRIHVILPRDLAALAPEEPEPPSDYDPSAAFAAEQEKAEADAAHDRLQADLDQADAQNRARARRNPPPPIVAAYRQAFGRWPQGWPP